MCRCVQCCSAGSGGCEDGVRGCRPDGENTEECNGEATGEGEGKVSSSHSIFKVPR